MLWTDLKIGTTFRRNAELWLNLYMIADVTPTRVRAVVMQYEHDIVFYVSSFCAADFIEVPWDEIPEHAHALD